MESVKLEIILQRAFDMMSVQWVQLQKIIQKWQYC